MQTAARKTRFSHLSLEQAKQTLRLLNAAGAGLALWLILWPLPYYPLIGLAFVVPILAIAINVWSGGALSHVAKRRSSNVGASEGFRFYTSQMAVLMCPIALSARAIGDFNFLDWRVMAFWTIFAAAGIGVLFIRLRAGNDSGVRLLIVAVLLGLLGSVGPLAFVNRILDPWPVHSSVVSIAAKRVHVSGNTKGSSIWYDVWVSPSPKGWTNIHVRPDVYRELRVGRRACLLTGTGLLGIGWLAVRPCEMF
jgi:hypothetical protein